MTPQHSHPTILYMEFQTLLILPNVFATGVGFLEECDTIGICLYYIVFDDENMKLCGEKGMET